MFWLCEVFGAFGAVAVEVVAFAEFGAPEFDGVCGVDVGDEDLVAFLDGAGGFYVQVVAVEGDGGVVVAAVVDEGGVGV